MSWLPVFEAQVVVLAPFFFFGWEPCCVELYWSWSIGVAVFPRLLSLLSSPAFMAAVSVRCIPAAVPLSLLPSLEPPFIESVVEFDR
jgi:hypothetical protein